MVGLMSHWFRAAKAHPCGVLLAVQILGILLYPFMETSAIGRALFSIFGLLVLVLAVWAVNRTPALNWIALLIGLPVVVLTILEVVHSDNVTISLWSNVLHALFYFYTAYGLIAYMFADNWVTRDEVFAIGAAFTVVAWGFAYVFAATQIIWPHSFIAAVNPDAPRTWMELLFLSVTTLTSTGLSDVVPVLSNARSVVMMEQIAGMLYLALVVARLVGLTIARTRR
jgi:Ion channel